MSYNSKNFSAQAWIWYNLKGYLSHYGTCILDLLLCPDNPDAEEPVGRYDDFGNQLNNHFNLMDFSRAQFGDYKYPYLGVDIEPLQAGKCEQKYKIIFSVYYHQPTPNCKNGCKKCQFTSAENTLLWKDKMINSISSLFGTSVYEPILDENGDPVLDSDGNICTNLRIKNFADHMRCNPDTITPGTSLVGMWKYNLRFDVSSEPFISSVRMEADRIFVFNVEYEITVNGAWGQGYCTGDNADCQIDCRNI